MRTVKGMEKEVKVVRQGCKVGRSEWDPMITATRGCAFSWATIEGGVVGLKV